MSDLVSYFADVLEILHNRNTTFIIIVLYDRPYCPYYLYNVITAIATRNIKWVSHEACIKEIRNDYKILAKERNGGDQVAVD